MLPHCYAQMSLLQSMSMGKAVIVSDVPAISDYITDGVDAIKVICGDAGDLARKIKALIDNPEKINLVGQGARNKITSRFNEEIMGRAIFDAARKVLDN